MKVNKTGQLVVLLQEKKLKANMYVTQLISESHFQVIKSNHYGFSRWSETDTLGVSTY